MQRIKAIAINLNKYLDIKIMNRRINMSCRFNDYGGQYVPQTRLKALNQLEEEHNKAIKTGRIFFDIQKINPNSKGEYNERKNS